MNRRLSVSLPLALVLASAAPVGMWIAPQDGAAPKVGVVDLRKLFESDAGLAAEIAAIHGRGKDLDVLIGKMREDYNTLKLECESIADKSTEKYVRSVAAVFGKEEEIDKCKVGLKAYLEQCGMQANLAALKRYKEAIAKVASGRSLDLVLRQSEIDEKEQSLSAQAQAAELTVVLYRDPKLDITEDVIKLLKAAK
ncbi:MAG: OmpH family outer membrane protein [Planctomycetota bacterium]